MHREVSSFCIYLLIFTYISVFIYLYLLIFLYLFTVFLWPHPQHVEVQARGQIKDTVITTPDLRRVCDPYHSSRQHLNPVSKTSDQTHILMDTGLVRYCCTNTGTPSLFILRGLKCRKRFEHFLFSGW